MKATEIVAVARMFDEAGYDGLICSDPPFDILLALLEPPTPDLYKRAEDIGITAVMAAPWMGVDLPPGDAERFREPIERFAETIITKVRR